MRKTFVLLAALALPAFAAQTATTTKSAELRSSPLADGAVLQTLPGGTSVEVVKRVGGWYQVRSGEHEGWVRMWLVRYASPPAGATPAVLQTGRATATYTTATTGVRGLSEEELNNAKPNPAAVAALEQFAVVAGDARAFAEQGELRAVELKEAP